MQLARTLVKIVLIFAWVEPLRAAPTTKIHQRFSLGGYVATERFNEESGGSTSNDFMVLSGRYYIRVHDFTDGRWEFVSDLRDKHDFFDKLDAERLELTGRNEFQVRQFSVRQPNPEGLFSPQLGRFAVPEAGAVYVDGGQAEFHIRRSMKVSGFGGLNPKQDSQSYLKYDDKAMVFGANLTLQDLTRGWYKNLYWSNAIVQKTYDGHVDRRYIFENFIYQWNAQSRLIALGYLDFVPRTYLQTANGIWQQGWTPSFSTDVDVLAIDSIEYSRRRSVLESLPSSPYRQVSTTLTYRPEARTRYSLKGLSGQRDVDGRSKTEFSAGWSSSGVLSSKWDFRVAGGVRKNFTSDDTFARVGTGYFSRRWESNADVDYAIQKNENGTTLHPLVTELSLANYWSRRMYSTLAFQRAADEDKTILTVFFRVGLQFSNQEVPPVRDGAPPRGPL